MKIAVEYIRWLQEERAKINALPLEEITFFENGMKVVVPKEVVNDWDFSGLNNTDFITSGRYKEPLVPAATPFPTRIEGIWIGPISEGTEDVHVL